MLRFSKRSLHSTASQLIRQKGPPLVIKPPIAPTVKNIKVSDDHPLWQYFHDKKFLRSYDEIDTSGRPWSIPELRRKSFDDLHSLWYTCLKERNVLAREIQVLTAETSQPDQQFLKASDDVRETMWRIRHVLSERFHAEERAKEVLESEQDGLLEEFSAYYLDASKEEESEIQEALGRLQYSLFGISEVIEENKVDKHFIKGLKYIANLKIQRFGSSSKEEILPIEDAGEAFIVFHAESNEKSILESIEAIKEMRSNGIAVDKYSEIDTIKEYLNRILKD